MKNIRIYLLLLCFFALFGISIGIQNGLFFSSKEFHSFNQRPCTSILATLTKSFQGKFLIAFGLILWNFSDCADFERPAMKFRGAKDLLEVKDHPKMSTIMSKISCLVTSVETDQDDEVSLLINMLNDMKVERKHLLLIVSKLNKTILNEKTINYNVGMYHKYKGIKFKMSILSIKSFLSLSEGRILTSLCPVLGKRYAQIIKGTCPKHGQDPLGKVLNVSWSGSPPFVLYGGPGYGSDFLVVKLLAEKFGFTPKFLLENIIDIVKSNGSSQGMIHKVSDTFFVNIWMQNFFHLFRFPQNRVRWALDNHLLDIIVTK